jgi:hypothetical protein
MSDVRRLQIDVRPASGCGFVADSAALRQALAEVNDVLPVLYLRGLSTDARVRVPPGLLTVSRTRVVALWP